MTMINERGFINPKTIKNTAASSAAANSAEKAKKNVNGLQQGTNFTQGLWNVGKGLVNFAINPTNDVPTLPTLPQIASTGKNDDDNSSGTTTQNTSGATPQTTSSATPPTVSGQTPTYINGRGPSFKRADDPTYTQDTKPSFTSADEVSKTLSPNPERERAEIPLKTSAPDPNKVSGENNPAKVSGETAPNKVAASSIEKAQSNESLKIQFNNFFQRINETRNYTDKFN